MIQHFTLTAKVQHATTPDETTFSLMAVCEERNEKWASGPLSARELRKALQGSQLTSEQVDEPIVHRRQVEFKAQDGKHMLFLEDELRKMHMERIPNR